jgi:LysR family glycine cleavage system transcriptional activator
MLWFQAQGIPNIGAPRGASFDDAGLLMKAVLAGQGAGLLSAAIVAPDIQQGRLVRLAEVTWLEEFACFLLYPEASYGRPNVAAFREWVLDAASGDNLMAGNTEPDHRPDHMEVPSSPALTA